MNKKDIIHQIIKSSNKTTIQTLVKNFEIERLGYLHPHIIEDAYNIKRGTASFGVAVSHIFEEYKVNRIELERLDSLINLSAKKVKLLPLLEDKKIHTAIHNKAVDEFRLLNAPLAKFVRLVNKILK